MFAGGITPSTDATPPVRVMVKLESGKERYQALWIMERLEVLSALLHASRDR